MKSSLLICLIFILNFSVFADESKQEINLLSDLQIIDQIIMVDYVVGGGQEQHYGRIEAKVSRTEVDLVDSDKKVVTLDLFVFDYTESGVFDSAKATRSVHVRKNLKRIVKLALEQSHLDANVVSDVKFNLPQIVIGVDRTRKLLK